MCCHLLVLLFSSYVAWIVFVGIFSQQYVWKLAIPEKNPHGSRTLSEKIPWNFQIIILQKVITQSILWYFDKIKVLESWLVINFCYSHRKNEIDFRCGPCWPCFCPRLRVFKKQFLKVFLIFTSELQHL